MPTRSSTARLAATLLLVAASVPSFGQAPTRRARLLVTVLDQTGAVLPNAPVLVTRQDSATATPPIPGHTAASGVAVFDDLEPAQYEIQGSFPGFQTVILREVRLRAGDNRRTLTLPLEKLDEAVTITRDKQSASLDARGSAFSTILTREQIEALPDDPDQMEEALKAMAPPGSTIRVDGFTGGRLPPKAQIRSIRLPRIDMFAAQNHGGMGGAMFIDIMTMPGAGPTRGTMDVNFFDDAMNARNAMTPEKGDEQLQQYTFMLAGTIKPNKTAYTLTAGGAAQFVSSNIYAILPDGTRYADAARQPIDRVNFSGRLDHTITRDHAVRASFDFIGSDSKNLGVGDFNLPERSYSSKQRTSMLRLSENGPLGRRFFWESRLQLRWMNIEQASDVQARTIRVNDAFTGGGAQVRGGRDETTFELASDLDYVRGSHSWRAGLLLEGGRYRSSDTSNYLGTYTFASLADYNAGRPSAFSQRIGDPDLSFTSVQAAAYLQDDWRVRRSLLVSAGVRYGIETQVGDAFNLSPRLSFAWSPLKNGSLTVRGNYGYFYDWIPSDLYKQTLLVDGYRQREFNIQDPSYPNPGLAGTTPPTNRYLWSDALSLPSAQRVSAGIDRSVTQNSRLNASYSYGWGRNLLRPRNLNAPVNGVRPDPQFANELELMSDAESKSHTINVGWNISRFNWHRTFAFVNYSWSKGDTNTAGAFTLLPGGDNLGVEWGPAAADARHRFSAQVSSEPIRNLSVSCNFGVRSATPYNITTGRDENGDGVFNDRPAGVSRNSARGAANVDLGGRLSYGWSFGPPRSGGGVGGGQQVVVAMGGGGSGASGGGAMVQATSVSGGQSDKRYRLDFYISGQNLLNRTNYTAFSGVMTSPLFGDPIAAAQARRLQAGVRFGF